MNKKIILPVIFSLTALVILQCWQLIRMYNDMVTNFNNKVESAIDKTIYNNAIGKQKIDINLDIVDQPNVKAFIIGNNTGNFNKMDIKINNGKIDVKSENNTLYLIKDSLLKENLLSAGIFEKFNLKLTNKDTIIHQTGDNIKNGIEFSRNLSENFKFKLSVENPNKSFLKSMLWLITISLTIILIIGFVIIYLTHTIFRQKSIEQIRRDFTHNITHELKTPISIAYAANDSLLNFSQTLTQEQKQKYLTNTAQSLENLSAMVDRILAISLEDEKGIKINRSEFLFSLFLNEIIEIYSQKYPKPIPHFIIISPENLTINADRFHFHNAIGNIIDNSLKYSTSDTQIHIKTILEQKNIIIEITDNGIGIPKSAQKHIFEKYYRVSTGNIQNSRGFGLGLYYVKNVIELHAGKISVSSTLGKETTIKIKIPQ